MAYLLDLSEELERKGNGGMKKLALPIILLAVIAIGFLIFWLVGRYF